MDNIELIEKINKISKADREEYLKYENLVKIVNNMNADEIIKLSNVIGYPVFTRMCMGELRHKFVLLQDGAAAIIVNKEGKILLQSRVDRDMWALPGGCQELGETFEDTIIREVKEETNFDVEEKDLKIIDIVSGNSRRHDYPNGDVVINNTVLYCIDNYSGELKWDKESKEMRFFSIDELPEKQLDEDLIKTYIKYLEKVEELH